MTVSEDDRMRITGVAILILNEIERFGRPSYVIPAQAGIQKNH